MPVSGSSKSASPGGLAVRRQKRYKPASPEPQGNGFKRKKAGLAQW